MFLVGGWSKCLDIAGNVAVMVRYQGQVAVFSISIPLGAPIDEPSCGAVTLSTNTCLPI